MTTFELLHKGVQRWLWDQRWTELRPIQTRAIETLLRTEKDVIISAPTAGGKTEAAFLPILSAIAEDYHLSIRAVYVGPLRALINDQFRRMDDLCSNLEIPVHRWHGEVGQGARKKVVSNPMGLLLITPESIESLLINRTSRLQAMFQGLSFLVIDELHVFPGTERGMHLKSLLHRLDLIRGTRVRRIGLSATLGAPEAVAKWLHGDAPQQVEIIKEDGDEREVKTRVFSYLPAPDRVEEVPANTIAPSSLAIAVAEAKQTNSDESRIPTILDLATDIVRHHRSGVSLIFANSKRQLEEVVPIVRECAQDVGLPDDWVLVHHGSLSRELREDAEQMLQQGGSRICFCSSTLELGIDIGSVRAVGHIGAPRTAASLAQRLGRSGRRQGEPAIFRQYIPLQECSEKEGVTEDGLQLDLVRGIALTELFLEGFVEAPDLDKKHLSVMAHQILSILAQHGGAPAQKLYQTLFHTDSFGGLTHGDLSAMLRRMGELDFIQQLPNGELLLASKGEALVNSLDFYAVFQAAEEWKVLHGNNPIGTIPIVNVFNLDDKLTLGGRNWRVTGISSADKEIEVVPFPGKKIPIFQGECADMSDRVVAKMRQTLASDDLPGFIDSVSLAALKLARRYYKEHALSQCWLTTATDGSLLWTWRGSRRNRTLAILLRVIGLKAHESEVGIFIEESNRTKLHNAFLSAKSLTPEHVSKYLTDNTDWVICAKYDHLVPKALLIQYFLRDELAIEATQKQLSAMLAGTIASSDVP